MSNPDLHTLLQMHRCSRSERTWWEKLFVIEYIYDFGAWGFIGTAILCAATGISDYWLLVPVGVMVAGVLLWMRFG